MRWKGSPILIANIQMRMRSWRAPVGISLYAAMILALSFVFYWFSDAATSTAIPQELGRDIYTVIAAFEMLLVLIVAPVLSAGAITGEREKGTLDLLLCSPMSAGEIIIGKMLSNMLYLFILLLSTLPVFTIGFYYGGVEIGDIIRLFLFYLVTALFASSIGTLSSTIFMRTSAATVVTNITMVFYCVITALIGFFQAMGAVAQAGDSLVEFPKILWCNPLFGLLALLADQWRDMDLIWSSFQYWGEGGWQGFFLGPSGFCMLLMLVVSVASIMLAAWRLRTYR